MKIFKLLATIILLSNVAKAGFLDTLNTAAKAVAEVDTPKTNTASSADDYITVGGKRYLKKDMLAEKKAREAAARTDTAAEESKDKETQQVPAKKQ